MQLRRFRNGGYAARRNNEGQFETFTAGHCKSNPDHFFSLLLLVLSVGILLTLYSNRGTEPWAGSNVLEQLRATFS